MKVVTLTTTSGSSQTWTVPGDCPAGTSLQAELWGAASGASGGSTSFRAGGAAGAYAVQPAYIVTTEDVASGIPFFINTGSAGTAGANPGAGPDTLFGPTRNLVPNNTFVGAVAGTPGTRPTGWAAYTNAVALTTQILTPATDVSTGLLYMDLVLSGTPTSTGTFVVFLGPINTPIASSTTYTASIYTAVPAGSLTNITFKECDLVDGTSFSNIASPNISTSGTLTRAKASGASSGTATIAFMRLQLGVTSGAAVNLTIRMAGMQFEAAADATTVVPTPVATAKGGGAPSGTTGGVGGLASGCVPSTGAFNGGSGATRTQGGGGGGSAGKNGAGASSTTGTGATGDNGSGGAANTSNVEGGGGATAGNPAGTPGDPGGGGGANTSTGSGSTGGRGQIRLTYPDFPRPLMCFPQMQPILAQ